MQENENKTIPTQEQSASTAAATEQATQGDTENKTAEKKPEKKEPPTYHFDVEPNEFPTDMSSTFMNSMQLKDKIDSMFSAIMADYYGCSIEINTPEKPKIISDFVPTNGIYVDLSFCMNTDPGYHALQDRASIAEASFATRMDSVLGNTGNYAHEIRPQVLEALQKLFVPAGAKVSNMNWRYRIIERQRSNPNPYFTGFNTGAFIETVVMGVPIESIIGKIYGTNEDDEDKTKERFSYGVSIVRSAYDPTKGMIFNITKVGSKGVDSLAKAMGVPSTNVYSPYGMSPLMYGYNGAGGFAQMGPNGYLGGNQAYGQQPGGPVPTK